MSIGFLAMAPAAAFVAVSKKRRRRVIILLKLALGSSLATLAMLLVYAVLELM